MRSLEIAEDSNTMTDVVDQYQVRKGRKWDERYVQDNIFGDLC